MENNQKSKGDIMAILSYLGILLIVPFLTDAKKDPFVKYHMKQGLVLLIGEVIGWFLQSVPGVGWMLWGIISLATLVLVIIGILNVVNGEEKELPFIGQYAKKFTF